MEQEKLCRYLLETWRLSSQSATENVAYRDSALEVYLYTTMRYINWHFTYLLTYLPRWITAILLSNGVCNPQNVAGKLNLLHLAVPTEMSMTTRMKWNLITRQGHVKVTSADHFAPAELQPGFFAPRYRSVLSLLSAVKRSLIVKILSHGHIYELS